MPGFASRIPTQKRPNLMNKHDLNVPKNLYDQILSEIENEESPVGIDAKKAHIIIIYKLQELEKRLDYIEQRLNKQE